jgi:hypothetical protein
MQKNRVISKVRPFLASSKINVCAKSLNLLASNLSLTSSYTVFDNSTNQTYVVVTPEELNNLKKTLDIGIDQPEVKDWKDEDSEEVYNIYVLNNNGELPN